MSDKVRFNMGCVQVRPVILTSYSNVFVDSGGKLLARFANVSCPTLCSKTIGLHQMSKVVVDSVFCIGLFSFINTFLAP